MSGESLPPIPIHAPGEGSIWQHFKTKAFYQVVTVGRHSETLEPLVVYKQLWAADEAPAPWIRSLAFSAENQWPGFLDLCGADGKTERFAYISGPMTRSEEGAGVQELGSLAFLVARAIQIEEKGPADFGFRGMLESNPNYRRLLRVIRSASETLFEPEQPTPEGPELAPAGA